MTLPLVYIVLLHRWAEARKRGDALLTAHLDEALRAVHAAHVIERGR